MKPKQRCFYKRNRTKLILVCKISTLALWFSAVLCVFYWTEIHYKTICSLSSYRWVKLCHPMSLQPMKSWGHWMLIMSWSSLEVWLATQAMTSTSSCGWCASQRGSTPETSGWERRPTHQPFSHRVDALSQQQFDNLPLLPQLRRNSHSKPVLQIKKRRHDDVCDFFQRVSPLSSC